MLFFYLLVWGVGLHAQETEGEEAKKKYSATTSFSAIASSGNAKEFTFSLESTHKFAFDKSQLDLYVGTIISASDGKRTSNLYNGYLKYKRNIRQRSYLLGLVSYERNTLAGFSSRYSLSLGVGHYIVKTEKRELQIEGGLGGTIEYLMPKVGNQTSPVNGSAHSGKNEYLQSRLFVRGAMAISESATISQEGQFLFNMKEAEDVRIYANTALTVTMVKHLALQMGLKIKYDNQPVPGYVKTDIITLSAIVISF